MIRGGYSRIFGRINGVNPDPGSDAHSRIDATGHLRWPDTLTGGLRWHHPVERLPRRRGLPCQWTLRAPLPPPSANLPQPWYPGFNDVATGSGETIDPNFQPDRSDEFTLSVQHQFGPKILAEVGYIGRILSNEVQYYSLTAVPYMMTRGGQSFANAWANVMVATNYGTNLSQYPRAAFLRECAGRAAHLIAPGPDPGCITGATSCTQAFVENNAVAS